MEVTGEYHIEAPRLAVWAALNDPEVLQACIPGCEEVIQLGENDYQAKVAAKIGPVKAQFIIKILLQDIIVAQRYTMVGEGQGGVSGFARGHAHIELSDVLSESPAPTKPNATLLKYDVEVKVDGKLAQIGSRLISGASSKLIDRFFARFTAQINPE